MVKESIGNAQLSIIRQNGADGDVSVKWRTIDKTAINGKDYNGGEGEIEFKHGETQRNLEIEIIDDMEYEKDENFEVEIYEVSSNAKLGKITKTAVTITNDDEFNGVMNKLMLMTNANVDELRVHNETWAQQFKDAMIVNGGDVESATTGDYIMHLITFGFKVNQIKKKYLCSIIFFFSANLRCYSSPRTAWRMALLCCLPDHDWPHCHHCGRPRRNFRMSSWLESGGT